MTALAAVVGLVVGWCLRGAVDRAIRDVIRRVMIGAIGRDRMLYALKQKIERGDQ